MGSWLKTAAAALTALALAAGATASAQPMLQDFLTQQLDNRELRNADDGYARIVGPLTGTLASAGAASHTLNNLRVGQEIRIVGVCDSACADLDLRVIDPRGRVIASDTRGDEHPSIDMRAEMFGQHTIEVDMADCGAARCRYAVNVYTR
ncbi:MAG: hypothetical protein AB7T59_14305 [Hyphomonadaceae bacterium]